MIWPGVASEVSSDDFVLTGTQLTHLLRRGQVEEDGEDCPHLERVPEHWTDASDQWVGERCTGCGLLRNVEHAGPRPRRGVGA